MIQYIRAFILIIFSILLSNYTYAREVKPADFKYRGKATKDSMTFAERTLRTNPEWLKSVLKVPIKTYKTSASGVAIAYAKHNETWALTAQHVGEKLFIGGIV